MCQRRFGLSSLDTHVGPASALSCTPDVFDPSLSSAIAELVSAIVTLLL